MNKKIFILMFCVILLVAPLISAGDWSDADNYKVFNEDDKYGIIEIWDTATLILLQFEDRKLIEYKLTRNTDFCAGWGCEAEGTATLYTDGSLFEDINFKTTYGGSKDIPYKFQIWKEDSYQEEVIDYKQSCEVIEVLKNGTEIKECEIIEIGSHFIKRDTSHWELYEGKRLDAGNYQWKINARVPRDNKIDWIAESFEIKLDDWAWWDTDYDYCYDLNVEGGGQSLDNFPVYVKLNSTVNSYIDTATWGNFRFVNKSCEEDGSSIPYEIDFNGTNDAGFWVKNPTLETGTNTWSIYVDSSDTKTLDESPLSVWSNNYTGVWHFDGNYLDSLGRMNCTNVGGGATLKTTGCAFGSCYYYDGTDDYLTCRGEDVSRTTPIYLSFFGNNSAAGDEGALGYTARDGVWTPPYQSADLATSTDGGNFIRFDFNAGGTINPDNYPQQPYPATSSNQIYWGGGFDGSFGYAVINTSILQSDPNDGTITYYGSNFTIGIKNPTQSGSYWSGQIDEGRVAKVIRSSNWISRTYNNPNLTLFSFGAEEESPPPSTTIIQSYPIDNFETADDTVGIGCNFTGETGETLSSVTLDVYDGEDNLDYTNTEGGLSGASYNKTWTTTELPDDTYLWACHVIGSSVVNSSGNRTLIVDDTPPVISIVYPENTTYPSNVSTLNYTYADDNFGYCWNSNNSGITNSSTTSAGTNFTNVFSNEGTNNWTLYCNDSLNNNNIDSIIFFKDGLDPVVDFDAETKVNNYNSSDDWIYVDVIVTETNEKNITFLLWNSTAEHDRTTYGTAIRNINWTSLNDDTYLYNVTVCDDYHSCGNTATRRLTIDATSPSIGINLPETLGDYHYVNLNLTLNWTASDLNIESCWYDYNTTNISVTCSENITQFIVVEYSNRNLTFYANDTFGNSNSLFHSWGYKVFQNSVSFVNSTTEGSKETFTINFTKDSSLQVSTIDLIYNNTYYSSSYSITGDQVIGTNEVRIPTKDAIENQSFYWSILLSDDSVINTTFYNQTINVLDVDNCSSFSHLIYNYTLYDEEDKTLLTNTSVEIQLNIYDLDRTLLILNFSQLYENENPSRICFNTSLSNNVNYSVDSVVKYEANVSGTYYSTEYYNILGEILTNSSLPYQIDLYDLLTADTTEFQLTFRDEDLSLAANILVYVYRQYVADNDFKIVEVPLTDSNGQTVLHLVRNDVIYNFIMKNANRETVATFNRVIAFCQDYTIGACSIELNAEGVGDIFYNHLEEVGISYSTSYSNETELISFNFLSDDSLPKTIGLEVIRNSDFGNRTLCQESLTSASGTITCDVSSVSDTDKFLFININVDGDVKIKNTIDLESESFNFGVNGLLIAFIMLLAITIMFMDDKQTLIIALVIGWIACIAFGLISGLVVGTLSSTIWLIVTAIIYLWKLRKEEAR